MASRGGYRPGSGRKKGSLDKDKAGKKLALEIAGVEPKVFLLKCLSIYNKALEAELAKPEKNQDKEVIRSAMAQGREFARDAAPYIHPKLNAVAAKFEGTITLESLVMQSVQDRGGK